MILVVQRIYQETIIQLWNEFYAEPCYFFLLPQAVQLLEGYCKDMKDSIMMDPPVWFQAFCICEVLFQLPFFFLAAYAFLKGYSELKILSSSRFSWTCIVLKSNFKLCVCTFQSKSIS